MDRGETTERLKTVDRLFEIVTALQKLDGARITELGDYTGLANSTIHRHVSTLNDLGYVVKEGDVYHVGLGFLDIGEYARNRKQVHQLAKQKVEELSDETNERCQFVVEEHGRGIYVHVGTRGHAVETDSRVGKRLYLHSTAVGKSILAHLPVAEIDKIIDQHGLPKQTENTITTREALETELAKVRKEGVAFNREGNTMGLRSVGAPVFDHNDQVVGAFSISGPTHRMKGSVYKETMPDLLLGAANELELNLRYS